MKTEVHASFPHDQSFRFQFPRAAAIVDDRQDFPPLFRRIHLSANLDRLLIDHDAYPACQSSGCKYLEQDPTQLLIGDLLALLGRRRRLPGVNRGWSLNGSRPSGRARFPWGFFRRLPGRGSVQEFQRVFPCLFPRFNQFAHLRGSVKKYSSDNHQTQNDCYY
jgi:hypothetical protein